MQVLYVLPGCPSPMSSLCVPHLCRLYLSLISFPLLSLALPNRRHKHQRSPSKKGHNIIKRKVLQIDRDREKDRERQRETERKTERDRETEREKERQRETETERDRDRETEREERPDWQ